MRPLNLKIARAVAVHMVAAGRQAVACSQGPVSVEIAVLHRMLLGIVGRVVELH